MPVVVVLGGQWGDEGKGKLVDLLCEKVDYVCRCQGGNNAGHTVIVDSVAYDFHLLPSGIINENCMSVMGNGMVINMRGLFEEIKKNEEKGLKRWKERLRISKRAHIVFDFHQDFDRLVEKEMEIGTTKKGIGPAYAAKCSRSGLRVGDLFTDRSILEEKLKKLVAGYEKRYPELKVDIAKELDKCEEYKTKLEPLVCDTVLLVNNAVKEGKTVLVEGANAVMLDIDFGTYPFVTSSNCTAGAVCTGLGIPPRAVSEVYGVFKAYTTRVGFGPFPTELNDAIGEKIQTIGKEFGVTTGRRRRCGWFDAMVARYSCMINGYSSIALTKIDILDGFEEVKIGVAYTCTLDGRKLPSMPCESSELERVEVEYVTLPGWDKTAGVTSFDELPKNAQTYVLKIEELLSVHIEWIGTGPTRESMIHRGRLISS